MSQEYITWSNFVIDLAKKLNIDSSNNISFVDTLDIKYRLIYGTGLKQIHDPDNINAIETDTFGSAGTVERDTRYVVDNPFGINTPVITKLELWYANLNKWANPGWGNVTHQYGTDGTGTICGPNLGEGIIVQCSNSYPANYAGRRAKNMSSHNINPPNISMPARIHVWKVGV